MPLLITLSLCAQAQTDTAITRTQGTLTGLISDPNISIYPVPVRENSFTIKSDREISELKITNIIGQDIFRNHYNNPLSIIKVMLLNPKRGMYLVSITFTDGTRLVRKIMIEGTI